MRYPFKQVDVFTKVPYLGNPVAVVLEAEGLAAEQMRQIAAWTNLSETTFVLPPVSDKADYRLRIFTPSTELPFAGHPSVGSAHAVLETRNVNSGNGRLVQECGAGLLGIEVLGEGADRQIFITCPAPSIDVLNESILAPLEEALQAELSAACSPLIVNVGPKWLIVEFPTSELVQQLMPNALLIKELSIELGITGITVFGFSDRKDIPIYVRSFAPAEGIDEDPVCGSGNACVAAYLKEHGLLQPVGDCYVANQGQEVSRNGFVSIKVGSQTGVIQIGGNSVTCIDGHIFAQDSK